MGGFMKSVRLLFVAIAVSMLGHSMVMAQDKKEPTPEERAVKSRQELMHVLATQRNVMRDMADNKRPTDAITFVNAANAMSALAKMIPDAFAKEGMTDDSTAKPDVWSNKTDFAAKAQALADRGSEIAKLASTDVAAAGKMAKDMEECGGCHDVYRIEEE